MQYSLGIQPELRSNFDFVFLLGEDFINNRKKLYEHYAGMFPTRDIFEQVFLQVTDNYGCMVINNRLRSSDIKLKVLGLRQKIEVFLKLVLMLFIIITIKNLIKIIILEMIL